MSYAHVDTKWVCATCVKGTDVVVRTGLPTIGPHSTTRSKCKRCSTKLATQKVKDMWLEPIK